MATRDRSSRTGAVGVDHLHLVHDVEVAATLPQQDVHVGQGLQPGPELARGPPHPLGHGPDLAVPLGHEHDDAIRLAQPVGAQHHPDVPEEAHRPASSS